MAELSEIIADDIKDMHTINMDRLEYYANNTSLEEIPEMLSTYESLLKNGELSTLNTHIEEVNTFLSNEPGVKPLDFTAEDFSKKAMMVMSDKFSPPQGTRGIDCDVPNAAAQTGLGTNNPGYCR